MDATVYLVWIGLIVTPPLAIALFRAARARGRAPLRRLLVVAALVPVALAGLALGRLTLIPVAGNVVACCAAYGAYCVLASACTLARSATVRWVVVPLAWVPVGLAYLLCSVGFPALALIADDVVRAPFRTELVGEDLVCRETVLGLDGQGGYEAALYRDWRMLSLKERLAAIPVAAGEAGRTPSSACADMAASQSRQPSS